MDALELRHATEQREDVGGVMSPIRNIRIFGDVSVCLPTADDITVFQRRRGYIRMDHVFFFFFMEEQCLMLTRLWPLPKLLCIVCGGGRGCR